MMMTQTNNKAILPPNINKMYKVECNYSMCIRLLCYTGDSAVSSLVKQIMAGQQNMRFEPMSFELSSNQPNQSNRCYNDDI